MKMNLNYIEEMNKVLSEYDNPKILLQACCAPCSSFCMLSLRRVARIKVFFYNPNITDGGEYEYRYSELKRLIDIYNSDGNILLPPECIQTKSSKEYDNPIELMEAEYEPSLFLDAVRGYEDCPERGERCSICFDLRLRETAIRAKEEGFDMFATTLTLSPLKNADAINSIGKKIADEVDIKYLPTDFKKKNGYKQSIILSEKYGLYRQNYCGCVYSVNK